MSAAGRAVVGLERSTSGRRRRASCPIRSATWRGCRFRRAPSEMTRSWIGNGLSMPRAASASTTSALTPSVANVIWSMCSFRCPERSGRYRDLYRDPEPQAERRTDPTGRHDCRPCYQGSSGAMPGEVRPGAARDARVALETWPRSPSRAAHRPPSASTPTSSQTVSGRSTRDGSTILSYGQGGGYGPLRELLAERHGVAAGRVFLTVGRPRGFVHLRRVAAGPQAGSRARRSADLRSPPEAARLAGRRDRRTADGR